MDPDPVEPLGEVDGIGDSDEMIRYVGDIDSQGHDQDADPEPDLTELPSAGVGARPYVSKPGPWNLCSSSVCSDL